jgi:single-stranded-DNA-specific exonuclease
MRYKLINKDEPNLFISSEIRNAIFKNRNVENIIEFMCPNESYLLNPFDLDNMQDGIDLLLSHINNKNKILIIVDSDADGFTSAAILYNYLKMVFEDIELDWVVHADKSHGINLNFIPLDSNIKLVICPDSSSNEYDKHTYLKERGIDTLVIDHHEALEYSKNAIVINNKLSSRYNNEWLSGAGVVFKFCQALDKIQQTNYAELFIDLAALGIVADMMDVRTMENRYIITEGLKKIKNPFFKELIKKQSYSLGSQSLNSIGVMFYISPLINAVTRVGTLEERETMFLAFIDGQNIVSSDKRGATEKDQETIAEKATRYAVNCRNRQKKLVDEIKENIKQTTDLTQFTKDPILLIKLDEISNRNITGLVANQLANEYKKPVLLLVDQGEQEFSGSGRNYGLSEIENLKDCLKDTNLFDFAEGHQSAFGAKISEENIDIFISRFQKIFPNVEVADDCYIVDFVFDADDFNVAAIREIARLRELWGKGFDEPLVAIENIPVNSRNLKVMGQKSQHLKFDYKNVTYIKFHVSQEEIDLFKDKDININVVGRCDVNIFRDNFSYQVIIENYEITKEESEFAF